MIASNTKVTITDAQFARDYILPATKDKTHVALRFLPHEYTRLSCWALQLVVPLCTILYWLRDTHHLDQFLTIDKHLKETHLENNLFVLKGLSSGITMRCTNSCTATIAQTRRLITASNRETCSPKERSSPKVVVVDY